MEPRILAGAGPHLRAPLPHPQCLGLTSADQTGEPEAHAAWKDT